MDYSSCTYISWAKYEESPEIMIHNNDILLVKTGSSYGKSAFVEDLPEKATINPQFVVLKETRINPQFLCYFLQSNYAKVNFDKLVVGTAIPTFSQANLNAMYIAFPGINEQKRIVNKILELLKYIDTINDEKKCLQSVILQTKSKILDLAIHGKLVPQDPNDEPASVLLERIRAEKEELIKQGKIKRDKKESVIFKGDDNSYYEKIGTEILCIDTEIPFKIPYSWTFVRLKHIGTVVGGGTPKTNISSYWDGEIPWLTPADLSGYTEMYISSGERKITEDGLNSSSTRLMPKGTVLYSSRAPIGYIALSNNPIATNKGFKSVVPYNFLMSEYLYYCLKARTSDIEQRATGTTFKEISGSAMAETIIPLPPINEQKAISLKAKSILSTLKNIKKMLN